MDEEFNPPNLEETAVLITKWAEARNLIEGSTIEAQYKKLREEFEELGEGIEKGDLAEITDGIGDMFVVLTIISELVGLKYYSEHYINPEHHDTSAGHYPFVAEFAHEAYQVIKDRKGRMVDGIFVKEIAE